MRLGARPPPGRLRGGRGLGEEGGGGGGGGGGWGGGRGGGGGGGWGGAGGGRGGRGRQGASAAFTAVDTWPMSALPVKRVLTTPMTRPMSPGPAAPSSATMACTAARVASADMRSGR